MIRLALLFVAISIAFAGCGSKPPPSPSRDVLDTSSQTRSELDQTIDNIARIDEFERGPATANMLALLNNYLSEQKADRDWKPDPMVDRLPRQLRSLPPVKELDSLDVQGSDPLYIEEAYLLRNIGNWVSKETPPKDLEAWVRSPASKLDRDQGQTLLAAYLLFDWTIRNIQLDPLPPVPQPAVAGPTGADPAQAAYPPPLRGVIGPGYTAYPWHVLMCGHGDAWQRMRIFILLCRQQGIDVAVLSTPDPEVENRVRPWLCGVLLGTQLYLFDTTIGLPIPGPEGQGIATLEQVRADAQLLRALDVDAEHKYPIDEKDIKSITAQIDASLECLSERMQLIERGLIGDRQLKLTIDTADLANRLRKSPGVANVGLWGVPIETTLFEAVMRQLTRQRAQMPPEHQNILAEWDLVENRALIGPGRTKHLQGKFSNTLDKLGAKARYLEARSFFLEVLNIEQVADLPKKYQEIALRFDRKSTEKEVEIPPESAQLLQQLADVMTIFSNKPEIAALQFKALQQQLAKGRDNTSYWIGLIHFETGNPRAAVDWLDGRTLQAHPNGPWTAGARYNLARAYEELGAYNLAQDLYIADESPQRQGNLLRAKRIQKQAAEKREQ